MKIDEAIEILDSLQGDGPYPQGDDLVNAISLGSEALKAIRADRLAGRPGTTTLLKGEDK